MRMRCFAILLCSVLCSAANDTIHPSLVNVCGEVPRAGLVPYEKGMTIETAVSKAGLDLRQFSKDEAADPHACPIRVILYRKGTITTYDLKLMRKRSGPHKFSHLTRSR